MHVSVRFRNDSLNQSVFFPSTRYRGVSLSLRCTHNLNQKTDASPLLHRPPPPFHPISSLYFIKSPQKSSRKGNSSSTQAMALRRTPTHHQPSLQSLLFIEKDTWGKDWRKVGLRWKAGRVSCLLGVALSMLMESEAKHSPPPACVPARKGDEADCGGGGWLEAGSEWPTPCLWCSGLFCMSYQGSHEAKAAPLMCTEFPPTLGWAKYMLKNHLELNLRQSRDSVSASRESDSNSCTWGTEQAIRRRGQAENNRLLTCSPFKPHLHAHSSWPLGGDLWKFPPFFSVWLRHKKSFFGEINAPQTWKSTLQTPNFESLSISTVLLCSA